MFSSVISNFIMIYIVIILYYESKGLSISKVMILNSIMALTTFLLEVPTGVVADRVSRLSVLRLADIISLFSFILIFLTDKFSFMIIAAILLGLGEALSSGTNSAYIYSFFQREKREDEYQSYISKIFTYSAIVSAVAAFLAGKLFSINKNLPMIISILIMAITTIFTFLMEKDIVPEKKEKKSGKELIKEEFISIKNILSDKKLIKIIYAYLVVTLVVSNTNFLSQLYLGESGIDIKYYAYVFLGFNLFTAAGSRFMKNKKKMKLNKNLFFYSVSLLMLWYINSPWAVVFFMITRFISGYIYPLLNVSINKNIDDKDRAKTLSLKSFFVQIIFIVFDPIIGFLTEYKGVRFIYLSLGVFLIVTILESNRRKMYIKGSVVRVEAEK